MPFDPTGFKRKRDEEEREKQWQRPTSQARVPKKTVVAQKIAAAKDKETAAPKTRKTPVPARKDEVKDISGRIARKAGERPIDRLTRTSQNSAPRIESAGTVIDTPNGPVTVTKVSPYSFAEHGLYYRALHGQELPKDASKLTEADLKALNDDGYRYETLMDYDLAGNQKRLDEMVTAEMRRTGKTRVSTPEIEKLRAEVNDAKLVQDYEASEKRKTELGLWNLGQKQQELASLRDAYEATNPGAGGVQTPSARRADPELVALGSAELADRIQSLEKDIADAKVIQYNNRGNEILAALETALGDAYEDTMRVAVNPAPNWDVAPGYDPYDYLTEEEKQLVGMQGVTAGDLAAGRYEQQQAERMSGARAEVEAKLKELGITDWSAKEVFDYYKNTEMERGLKANAAALQDAIQKHPAAAAVFSLTAPFLSVMSGLGGLDALGQKIAHPDRPVNFYSAADAASLYLDTITGTTSQQIHDAVKNATGSDLLAGAASFGYNAGESILDNGVRNLLVLGGVPPTASLGIMATGAASSSMRMAHERGLSDDQALTLGVISGMTEYATEKIGLDELLNTIGKAGKSRTFMQNLWRNTLAEGGEEGISGVVGVWADVIIAKDESEWRKAIDSYRLQGYSDKDALTMALFDQANEIGLDMLAGGLSGGVMGGAAHISNQAQENRAQNLVNVASVASQIAGVSEDLTPLENDVAQQAVDLMSSSKKGDKSKAVTAVMQSKEAQQALGLDFADGTSVTEKRTAIKEALTQRANVETAAAAGKAAEELIALQQEISGAEELSDEQRGAYSDAVNTLQDAVDRMDPETRKQAKSVVRQAAQIQKAKAKEMKAAEKQAGETASTPGAANDKKQSAPETSAAREQKSVPSSAVNVRNKTAQKAVQMAKSGKDVDIAKAVGMVVQSEKAQKALGLTFDKGTSMTEKRAQIRETLTSLANAGAAQTQAADTSTAVSAETESADAHTVVEAVDNEIEADAKRQVGNKTETNTAEINLVLDQQRTSLDYFAKWYRGAINAEATDDEVKEEFQALQENSFVAGGKLWTKPEFEKEYRKTHPDASQAEIDTVFRYAQEEANKTIASLDRAAYNKSDKKSAVAVKEEQHVQETESDAQEGGNAEKGQHRGESGSGELAGRAGKRSDERSERVSRRAEGTSKAAADRRDGHRSVDQRTAEEQRSDQTGVRGSMPGAGGKTRSDDVLHRRAAEEKAGANAGRGEGTGRVRGVNTEEAERVRGLNLKTKKMTLEPNTPGDRVVDNQDLPERYRPSLKKAAKLGLRVRWLLGRHVNQEGRSVPGVQFGRTIIASLDSDFRDGLQLFDHEFGHAAFRLVPGLKEKVLKRLKQLGVDDDILFDVAKDNYRRSHEKHYGKLTKDNAGLFIEEFLVDAYAGIQKTQVTDGLFGKVRKVTVALIDGGVDQVAKARGVDITGNKYFEIDEDDIPDYAYGEAEDDEDYEDPYEDVLPEDKHPDVEVGSWEDTGDADVDDGYYDDPGKDEDAPSGLGPEQVIYDPERLAYYAKQSGRLVIYDETSQTFLYDEFGDAFEEADDPGVVIDAEKEKAPDLSEPPGFTGEDSAEAERKPTNTDTEAFKRWFHDPTKNKELSASKRSKKPKTLFHGSIAAGFTKFVTALNSSSNFGGIYLTDDEATAQAYADGNGREFKPVVVKSWSEAQHYARRDLGMRLEENDDGAYDLYAYNEKTGLFEVRDTFTADEAGLQSFNEVFGEAHNGVRTPGVYKLYGTSDNALVIDAHGRDWQHVLYDPLGRSIDADQQNTVGKWWRTDDIVDRAFASGYDCVIFKNVVEGVSALCNDYVFKDPAQVKSVYNEGTWDRQNDDVRYYDEDESEQHSDLALHYDETNGSYTFDGKTYANLDEFKAAAPEFLDDYEEWELEPLKNALKALGLDPDEILARVLRRGQPGYADVVDNLPRHPRPRAKEQPGFSADYGSGSERGLDFGQVIYDPAYDNDQQPTAFFEASTGKPVYFDRQSQLFLYDEVREMLGAEDPSLVQALEKKSHFKDFENDRYSTNRGPSKHVYGHRRTEETETEKKQLLRGNMRKTGLGDFVQNLITWFNDPTKTGELTRATGMPRELYMGTPLAGLTELRKNALRRRGFFTSQLRDTAMNYGGSQEFVPRHLDSWEQAQAYISNELGLLFLDHFESDGTWLLLAEDPETGVLEELRSYDDTEEGLQELNHTYGEMYVEAAKITRQSHSGFYRVYGTSDKAFVLDVDGEVWSRLLFNPTGLVANPLLKHNSTGKDYWDTDDLADFMFSQGYDLVVVKNVTDGSGPDNDDFIFRDPGQIKSIYNVGTWDRFNPDVRYYDEDENEILPPEYSYAEQVEMTLDGSLDSKVKAVIDDNGNRTASAVYVSFDTPNVLRSANLQDLPLLMTQRHLRDIYHTRQEYADGSPKPGNASYHGISKAKLKKVPALLARPAMILDAPGETHKGDIIVVTTERDYRGRPIVVTIHPNGNAVYDGVEGPANFITSVYGYGKNPGDILGLISLAVRQNRVIYAQKQRSQAIVTRAGDHTRRSEVSGRQLDQKRVSREDYAEKIGLNQLDYDRIIHKIPDPVNGKQLRKFYDEDTGDVGQTPDTFESIVARAEAAYQQAMGDTAARAVTAKDLGSVAQADEALLQWVIHRHQYGAIPQTGSNNARKVEAPKSVDGKKVVSKTVSTVMSAEATPEKRLMTVVSAVEGGKLSHVPITDKIAERRAEAAIEKDGFQETRLAWGKEVAKGKASKDLVTLGAALLNNAGNSDATGREYVSILMDYSDLLTRAGQALQAAKMLKKLSPDAKLYVAQKRVDTINAELAKRGLDPSQYGVEIDPELIDAYRRAKTDAERDEIMTLIAQNIADQIQPTAMDKFTAWRYLAMLGNLRTQTRNVLGNTTMQPIRMLKADIAGLTEALIQRLGGNIERTQSVLRDSETFKAAMEEFNSVRAVIMGGGKYDDSRRFSQEIEEKRRIFKFAPLEYWRKATNWMMDKGDELFCSFTYADALARYIKANGATWSKASEALKDKAREFAIREAAEATYRDNNAFSNFVVNLRVKNPDNVVKKAASVVIEGVLPFRKTPANILARTVEYSPLGLLRGAYSATVKAVGKNNVTGAEIVNQLSKGLTGSGLLALGLLLAAKGVLVGGPPDDDKEKEQWKREGHQAYALEIGGHSYTLDWMAPSCVPFFLGANLHDAFLEEGLTLDSALSALRTISDPVLEMSMLQGIQDLIDNAANYGDESALVRLTTDAAWSFVTQLTPTLLGQAERASDNTRYQTYTDKNSWVPTDVQYALGKLSAKIPGWDYGQIVYTDAWGRTHSNADTTTLNIIQQFFSPGYLSKIETSAMEKELRRLYEATGDSGVLISSAQKRIEYTWEDANGEKHHERMELTGDQYLTYNTTRGQLAYRVLTELTNSAAYAKMSDEDKVKCVDYAYTYATQIGKKEVAGENFSLDSWVNNARNAKEDLGITDAEFIAARVKYGTTYFSGAAYEKLKEAVNQGVGLEDYVKLHDNVDTFRVSITPQTQVNEYLESSDLPNSQKAVLWAQGVTGSAKDKMDAAIAGGVKLEDYYLMKTHIDADGSGSVTQAEAQAYLDSTSLSRKQKSLLWSLINSGWKKNPYA